MIQLTLIEPHCEAPEVAPGIRMLTFTDAPSGISVTVMLDADAAQKIASVVTGRQIVVPSGPMMATKL